MPTAFDCRAVLLDMDGTLVDSTAAVERAWREWARLRGVDFALIEPVMHGRQAFVTMADVLPERPVAENMADNEWMLRRESADLQGVVEVAGAGVLLSSLQGMPHAVVTSADVGLMRARMGAAGLTVPDVAVTAEDVRQSKPAPDGFLLAASRLGVAPADCVVFEDSGAGIAAARAAGMRVVAVGERDDGDARVTDLRGIRVRAAPDGVLTVTVP